MTVRTKMIFALVGLVSISLVISGILSVERGQTIVSDIVVNDNYQLANFIANELNRILTETILGFKLTGSMKQVWTLNKDDMSQVFQRFIGAQEKHSLIRKIAVYDIRGNYIFSTDETEDPSFLGPWYSSLISGTVDGYCSNISIKKSFHSQTPVMYYSILIKDKLYNIVGVMIAELDLTYFSEILHKLQLDKNDTEVYFTSSKGEIFASSNGETVFKYGEEIPYTLPYEKESKIFKYKSAKKKDYLIVARKLNWDKKFNIFVLRNLNTVLAPLNKLKYSFMVLISLCIFTAIILAIGIAFTITLPLNQLLKEVDLITKGDLSQSIESLSDDEIGTLAEHFEQMRLSLKEKIFELDLLNRVGKDMTKELDYDKVLKLILEKVASVMCADKASIMIFDEDTGKLVIQVAQGLEDSVIKETMVEKGEGVVGMVVESGRPIYVPDASNSEFLKDIKKSEISSGTFLCVPLMVKGEIKGVVNVSKQVPNFFTSRHIELYKSLVNSAAIAYENARLYKMAITDGMTKLYIHRYFQTRLQEELARSKRYEIPVSLIMTDIDHFKNFNDTYGHQVGDEVLKAVANIIQQQMRDVDIVARYGGEEFVVICPEKSSSEVMIAAERMRRAVEEHEFMVAGEKVQITISLGLSDYPNDADTKKDLIEKADTALYRAKQTGRNRIVIYSAIKEELGESINEFS
ncbi:diguanylate cyclase [bacterium]|nr:diguanylate cyclase [bacterium]